MGPSPPKSKLRSPKPVSTLRPQLVDTTDLGPSHSYVLVELPPSWGPGPQGLQHLQHRDQWLLSPLPWPPAPPAPAAPSCPSSCPPGAGGLRRQSSGLYLHREVKVPVWGLKFWQLALSPGWPLTPGLTVNSVPADPGGQEEELLAAAGALLAKGQGLKVSTALLPSRSLRTLQKQWLEVLSTGQHMLTLLFMGPFPFMPSSSSSPPSGGYLFSTQCGYSWTRTHPTKLVKTAELPPDHSYLLVAHPCWVTCFGHFCNFATESTGFSQQFPGLRP